MGTVVMVLDLMHVYNFYYQTLAGGTEVVCFEAGMSASVHVDNKKKDILVLGEGPAQGLDHTTITVEANNLINFTESGKKCGLSLHCNGRNSYLFLMPQKYINSA